MKFGGPPPLCGDCRYRPGKLVAQSGAAVTWQGDVMPQAHRSRDDRSGNDRHFIEGTAVSTLVDDRTVRPPKFHDAPLGLSACATDRLVHGTLRLFASMDGDDAWRLAPPRAARNHICGCLFQMKCRPHAHRISSSPTVPPSPSHRLMARTSRRLNFSRTPTPPPFSPMKTTPPCSSAVRRRRSTSSPGAWYPDSKFSMAFKPTLEVRESSSTDQSMSARAARHWAAVMTGTLSGMASTHQRPGERLPGRA